MKASSLVLSVALITLTAVGLVSPALAASKVTDVREQNMSETFPAFGVVCGSMISSVTFHTREASFVLWDNGHFELHMKESRFAFESGGARIAQTQTETIAVAGQGGLPLTLQVNTVTTCGGASATPGLLSHVFMGMTIGEDGRPKSLRFHM